jgi:hypothetical protein
MIKKLTTVGIRLVYYNRSLLLFHKGRFWDPFWLLVLFNQTVFGWYCKFRSDLIIEYRMLANIWRVFICLLKLNRWLTKRRLFWRCYWSVRFVYWRLNALFQNKLRVIFRTLTSYIRWEFICERSLPTYAFRI